MWIALLLSAVIWSHPAPQIYVCNPGHTITPIPSNCELIHPVLLAKLRLF
jgi:hypothetical protein